MAVQQEALEQTSLRTTQLGCRTVLKTSMNIAVRQDNTNYRKTICSQSTCWWHMVTVLATAKICPSGWNYDFLPGFVFLVCVFMYICNRCRLSINHGVGALIQNCWSVLSKTSSPQLSLRVRLAPCIAGPLSLACVFEWLTKKQNCIVLLLRIAILM